jgi:DNA primase
LEGFEQRLKQAMPLSEFFFAELSKDVNLAGLEGKARLAERAKPLLAGIPDGAFRDLMYAALADRTGVRIGPAAASAPPAPEPPPSARARRLRPGAGPKRSLVRSAIALLVQRPALVHAMQPPYLFGVLRQPGIPLLMELIDLVRARPDIATGGILEHFAGRAEQAALEKLSLMEFPAAPETWTVEFLDALEQLNRQTIQQRIEDLLEKQSAGPLSEAEKAELREALAAKARR